MAGEEGREERGELSGWRGERGEEKKHGGQDNDEVVAGGNHLFVSQIQLM